MYDFEWHKLHAAKTKLSAQVILSQVRDLYPFASLIDIGCGDGLWLDASETLGCSTNRGVDGPWTDLSRIVVDAKNIDIQDLTKRFNLGRFDIALSLEVAEHIDKAFADIFIDNIVSHADMIVFGAAIPYQGGYRHLNEQWQSYWLKKFKARGFASFDLLRSQIWDNADVHFWYKQNTLVYVNQRRSDLIEMIQSYIKLKSIAGYPIDMVHPEKYTAIASYDQIAFRPLLRNLPVRAARKVGAMVTGTI